MSVANLNDDCFFMYVATANYDSGIIAEAGKGAKKGTIAWVNCGGQWTCKGEKTNIAAKYLPKACK